MKNLKLVVLSMALVFASTVFAGVEKVVIKTSAQCEMCQEKLETAIGEMNGVKKVMLNIESKELSVKFDNEKVTKAEIVKEINGLGYWADGSQPDKAAYAKLDDCCKPKQKKSCCVSKAGKTSCSKDAANKGAEKSCCSGKDAAAKKECSHK